MSASPIVRSPSPWPWGWTVTELSFCFFTTVEPSQHSVFNKLTAKFNCSTIIVTCSSVILPHSYTLHQAAMHEIVGTSCGIGNWTASNLFSSSAVNTKGIKNEACFAASVAFTNILCKHNLI
eukprot:Gb_36484 [translate_table: standard]